MNRCLIASDSLSRNRIIDKVDHGFDANCKRRRVPTPSLYRYLPLSLTVSICLCLSPSLSLCLCLRRSLCIKCVSLFLFSRSLSLSLSFSPILFLSIDDEANVNSGSSIPLMPLLHPSQSPTPTDKAPPPTDWNSPDYFHPRCPLRPLPTITDKN